MVCAYVVCIAVYKYMCTRYLFGGGGTLDVMIYNYCESFEVGLSYTGFIANDGFWDNSYNIINNIYCKVSVCVSVCVGVCICTIK